MKNAEKIALTILFFLSIQTPLAAAPQLMFMQNFDTVGARGVSPGGDVLFLSASREKIDWTPQVTSRLDFAQSNPKGLVYLNNVTVVDPSIWVAVDLSTSALGAASPGNQYEATPVQESGFLAGGEFVYEGERLDLVVVRNGKAWHARAYDGGPGDSGPASDGQVAIAFSDLDKVYPTVGWAVLYGSPQNGDVVVGIDAGQMTYFTMTLSGLGGQTE